MIVRKCDRCGKIYDPSVKEEDEYREYILSRTNTYRDCINTLRHNEIEYDLCDDCIESLRQWFMAGPN